MVFLDERAYRARKNLGGFQGFGQCTGENWSPVQEYDSNRLAGMRLYCIAREQGFLPGGALPWGEDSTRGGIAPLCPPVATSLPATGALSVFVLVAVVSGSHTAGTESACFAGTDDCGVNSPSLILWEFIWCSLLEYGSFVAFGRESTSYAFLVVWVSFSYCGVNFCGTIS